MKPQNGAVNVLPAVNGTPCREGISVSAAPSKSPSAAKPSSDARAMKLSEISSTGEHRYKTGFSELDRVLGGGIVKGAVMLISGDPGIGKSTIMLQNMPKAFRT